MRSKTTKKRPKGLEYEQTKQNKQKLKKYIENGGRKANK